MSVDLPMIVPRRPTAHLMARVDELDQTAPTVVYCAGGYRSTIAASALRERGFTDVSDVLGGFSAWAASGQEVERTPT